MPQQELLYPNTGTKSQLLTYHQISNITFTLLGNKIVYHSDVAEALPVSAAPIT